MTDNTTNLEAHVRELRTLKDEKDRLNDRMKEVNKRIDYLSKNIIPEAMEGLGDNFRSFKVEGVGTVSLKDEVYPYVRADDRTALYSALRATGAGDIIVDHIHPQTLKSWVKDQMEEGHEIPDEVQVTTAKVANLRRS